MYERGFSGIDLDPNRAYAAKEEFYNRVSIPDADDVCHAYGFADSAAGKLVIPFQYIEKYYPGSMPGPAQRRGDCQNGSVLVTAKDGSVRKISEVNVGDEVVTHTGQVKTVTDTIKKPYDGKMVSLSFEEVSHKLEATPDHKILVRKELNNEWIKIEDVQINDRVVYRDINNDFKLVKVVSIDSINHSDYVYCLEVLDDHSFVSNGFVVHNCVSHGQKNANLLTLCTEVAAGIPDEKTGFLEEPPEVSAEGIRAGVLSTEAIYWFRGHGRDGWHCPSSASVSLKYCGALVRQNYEGIADLTNYSAKTAGKWGSKKPPSDVIDRIDNNLFRDATRARSFEAVRDLLNRGFGINTCGGEGFAKRRDENGVAKRSGSWAHAMAVIAADDRDIVKQKYNGPLVLILNSWGPGWISGPRTIMGTNIQIPHGAFWAKWSDVSRRDFTAMSGLNGWKRKELPDLSPHYI